MKAAHRPVATAAMLGAVALAGCVIVPSTATTYDADCAITSRRMQLEPVQLGYIAGCHGRECGALLVAAGAAALASAVISGSIAVVGNVVYWLEERGQCSGMLPRAAGADRSSGPSVPAPAR